MKTQLQDRRQPVRTGVVEHGSRGMRSIRSCHHAATGEDTADLDVLVCAVMKCRVLEVVTELF
jgi:hypothetical protein